jgi:uncharacterized protein YjbJ (UPF0337 family)
MVPRLRSQTNPDGCVRGGAGPIEADLENGSFLGKIGGAMKLVFQKHTISSVRHVLFGMPDGLASQFSFFPPTQLLIPKCLDLIFCTGSCLRLTRNGNRGTLAAQRPAQAIELDFLSICNRIFYICHNCCVRQCNTADQGIGGHWHITGLLPPDGHRLCNDYQGLGYQGRRMMPRDSKLPECRRRGVVSWELIQGRWSEFKGRLKEQWGLLTTDFDLVLDGRRDQNLGVHLLRCARARMHTEEKIRDVYRR